MIFEIMPEYPVQYGLTTDKGVTACTGSPLVVKVYLHDPATHTLLWSTTSKADGSIAIRGLEAGRKYLPVFVRGDGDDAEALRAIEAQLI